MVSSINASCTLAVLVVLWTCITVSCERQLDLINNRLMNIARLKNRRFPNSKSRYGPLLDRDLPFPGNILTAKRSRVQDLREDNAFQVNPGAECCPSMAELKIKTSAVNYAGVLVELLVAQGNYQTFYTHRCHSLIKDKPCRYIDRKWKSRCKQQYTYVYAVARGYNMTQQQYRLDRIRVQSGCKCEVFDGSQTTGGGDVRAVENTKRDLWSVLAGSR